jgi:cyclophilin family peptidyl-prolyl cis-trans isomerase
MTRHQEGSKMSLLGPRHKQWKEPPAMRIDPARMYHAVVETSKGIVQLDLLADEAPKTVNNFVFLAEEGFYENVPFHRIISGFMIQTGDPTGTGSGGPGYRFEDEKVNRSYDRGTVAMANAGPNTNGSQFFIMHQSRPLPPNYTIFGTVSYGMDVVDAIAGVAVGPNRSGEASSPKEEVKINRVSIREE